MTSSGGNNDKDDGTSKAQLKNDDRTVQPRNDRKTTENDLTKKR